MGALQSPTQGWLIRRRLQRKPWPLQSNRSASCTPSRSTLRRWAPPLANLTLPAVAPLPPTLHRPFIQIDGASHRYVRSLT